MIQLEHSVSVNNRVEPAWKDHVDRWYQLDEIGFAICEAMWSWKSKDLAQPKLVLLAMEGLSTVADFDFVATGASSPAKFVFTLPNICASVLFQVLGIHTKVFCLNAGPKTVEFAHAQAEKFAKHYDNVWVLSSSPTLQNGKRTISLAIF